MNKTELWEVSFDTARNVQHTVCVNNSVTLNPIFNPLVKAKLAQCVK